MNPKKDITDTIFQQSFEEFAAPPSVGVWASLEKQLLEKNAPKKQQKKRWFLFFLSLGLIAVVCLGSSYFIFQKNGIEILSNQNANSVERENKSKLEKQTEVKEAINNSSTQTIANEESSSIKQMEKRILTEKNSLAVANNSDNLIESDLSSKENLSLNTLINSLNIEKEAMLEEDITTSINKDTKANFYKQKEFLKLDLLKLEALGLESIAPTIYQDALKGKKMARFSFTIWASQSQFNRKLKDNPSVSGIQSEFFNQHESKSTNWSYGMKIGLNLKQGWRLESGLAFIQFSMLSHYDLPTIFMENAPSKAILFTSFSTNNIQFNLKNTVGLETGDLISIQENIEQKIRWLSVPLMATYVMGKGRFQLSASAGLTANFFLNSELSLKKSGTEIKNFQTTLSETAAGKTHLGYRGEINSHYRTSPKNSLFIGIHYQNAISAANKQKSVKFYPSMFGWQMGMQRNF